MTPAAATAPDVVATWAQADRLDQPPLVVLEGLREVLPGTGEIAADRLGDGHSNATFLVTRDGSSWVLRRPPRPPYAARAHDVAREFRVLQALRGSAVPVPVPVALHEDEALVGAPFYLMDAVAGDVVADAFPAHLDTPQQRRRACTELVDVLARIHDHDWVAGPLADLSPGGDPLDRMLRRTERLWEHNATRDVPELVALHEWLVDNRPAAPSPTLAHGDFKLDNVVWAPAAPARLAAVLDWELASVGAPLADLGWLVATWVDPGETPDPLLGFSPATAAPGCLTRAELVAHYGRATGRDTGDADWYERLAVWRIAVIVEGNYKRFVGGGSDDPFLARAAEGVPRIAARALATAP